MKDIETQQYQNHSLANATLTALSAVFDDWYGITLNLTHAHYLDYNHPVERAF